MASINLPNAVPTEFVESASERDKAPNYSAILIASSVLGVAGVISYLLAAAMFATSYTLFTSERASFAGFGGTGLALMALVAGFTFLVVGALFRWFSSIGIAIRDMAINSFRQIESSEQPK